jgi:hypothetical protein
MLSKKINLNNLLSEFGKSMIQAQTQIDAEALENSNSAKTSQTGIAISEIEFDVKMVIDDDATGGLNIHPVSGDTTQLEKLNPGVFSSIRARLLAVPDETVRPSIRKPSKIREEVLATPDVVRLQEIFGKLDVDIAYVAAKSRWLVDIKESSGITLRSFQVEDMQIERK